MNRTESFEAVSVGTLAVHLAWAALEIMTDDVEDIQVLISGDDEDVEAMRVSFADGRLLVEQPTYGLTYKLNMVRWMQLHVRIPHAWKGTVEASTIAGPLTARRITGSDVTLETVSGALRVSDITALGASLHAVTGDILAQSIACEKLNLRTVSGSVELSGSQQRAIHFNTVTGAVALTLADPFDQLEGNTVSGDLTVSAPIDTADVVMKGVSGRLRTSGVSLNDGPRVAVNSVSGDVTLTSTL